MQDTHHLSYRYVFNEPLHDLLGLCKDCHEWVHNRSSIDPCWPVELKTEILLKELIPKRIELEEKKPEPSVFISEEADYLQVSDSESGRILDELRNAF